MKIKNLILAGVAILIVAPAMAGKDKKAVAAPSQAVDTVSVAVGTVLGDYMGETLQRMRSLGIDVNTEVFVRTVSDVLKGQSTGMTVESANEWLDRYVAATRPADLPEAYSVESQVAFMDSVAQLPGAVRYPDGLVMIVELEGEGNMPTDEDIVKVMYTGRLYDGTEFDATSSPISFKVNELAKGFSEGLKLMRPGGRYRIVMPSSLAYGPQGIPGAIPGNAALDFTVDLIEITH